MKKKTVRDLDVRGRRVLVRADLNVPLRAGAVADDSRIRATLPTLQFLLENEATVVACSHLGRPQGRVRAELRLRPVAERLQELLRRPVRMASDSVGPDVKAAVKALEPGEVLLLENLRFHSGEEGNERRFARLLAQPVELYVNDAFGAAHRAHASTEAIAHLLPAAAGLLMEREIENLANVFPANGRRRGQTVTVVSGGAKVSDKLGLLRALVQKANSLCIGSAMANTFLLAQGMAVGASLAEPSLVDEARALLSAAERAGCEVLLPVDGVIARGPEQPPRARPLVFAEESVPEGWQIFDVGPRTIERFRGALESADVVVWNGPLGLFEREAFAGGTRWLARALAGLEGKTIVCGGETLQAVAEAGVADRLTHVSTGGGAALELLEGRELPGLAVLPDAQPAKAR